MELKIIKNRRIQNRNHMMLVSRAYYRYLLTLVDKFTDVL